MVLQQAAASATSIGPGQAPSPQKTPGINIDFSRPPPSASRALALPSGIPGWGFFPLDNMNRVSTKVRSFLLISISIGVVGQIYPGPVPPSLDSLVPKKLVMTNLKFSHKVCFG